MFFLNLLILTLPCEFRVHRAGSQLKTIRSSLTTSREMGDIRRRRMDETVRIERNDGIMMNRKGEFRNSVLPRLVVHRGAER